MANVLFLPQRLPYPPNKGDKVRSYHLLKELLGHHRVFLGTFIDDPEDEVHVATLRKLCADVHVARLSPLPARLRSLVALAGNAPLTLSYFRDAGLQNWVDRTMKSHHIDAAVVFSSSMAPYAPIDGSLPVLVDFVDVDSAKWAQYADMHRWPMSWVYRREARVLLTHERQVAARAHRSFFTTDREAALFRQLAPESAERTESMGNGVDADYFQVDPDRGSPFAPGERALVFTGAMDYWPNVDAVSWFVADMLPALTERFPDMRLHVVGRSPGAAVKALASPSVVVTGTVPDVRPYLQHAAVVVAPLRLARGVQNKVLEAMAMSRPVVTSAACAQAISATPGSDLLQADGAEGFIALVDSLLNNPDRAREMGQAARRCVLSSYTWSAHLARLTAHLSVCAEGQVA